MSGNELEKYMKDTCVEKIGIFLGIKTLMGVILKKVLSLTWDKFLRPYI